MHGRREFGDYQTPREFAREICSFLKNGKRVRAEVVIEPTCGKGNFIQEATIFDARKLIGLEINPEYCATAAKMIKDPRVEIINADFFAADFSALIPESARTLVIGNPPWVTNSELSVLNSGNLPHKRNFKGLKAFDALTGSSNFDICESIILRMIEATQGTDSVVAMLCKTSVARGIFEEVMRRDIPFSAFELYEFDAGEVFNVNVNACLLFIKLAKRHESDVCRVYSSFANDEPKSILEYAEGKLVPQSNASARQLDGECEFQWRQGVKHDCSAIMELKYDNSRRRYVNGNDEEIQLENDFIFPLVKSSMFKSPVISSFSKYLIVPQRKLREETKSIESLAPQTWSYLNANRRYFDKRKSSIYRNTPPFSVFGVGDYSFAKYKVGVSGFYKTPLFSLVYSKSGKPVMVDDTSYFLPFDTFEDAYTAMLLLNSEVAQRFFTSVAFLDSKRPYTKKVLARLEFRKLLEVVDFEKLKDVEATLGLPATARESYWRSLIRKLDQKAPRVLTLF